MYRANYFQCYDFVINAVNGRFDQPDYKMYSVMENIILNAVSGKGFSSLFYKEVFEDGSSFEDVYGEDIDISKLTIQLQFLPDLLKVPNTEASFHEILKSLRSLSKTVRVMITEVIKLVKLILLAPSTNAEGERTFSGLRRVKTYLRPTMKQKRLNNLMIIHVHKERVDSLDIIDIANEFVNRNDSRKKTFGQFIKQDLLSNKLEFKSVGTQTG